MCKDKKNIYAIIFTSRMLKKKKNNNKWKFLSRGGYSNEVSGAGEGCVPWFVYMFRNGQNAESMLGLKTYWDVLIGQDFRGTLMDGWLGFLQKKIKWNSNPYKENNPIFVIVSTVYNAFHEKKKAQTWYIWRHIIYALRCKLPQLLTCHLLQWPWSFRSRLGVRGRMSMTCLGADWPPL